MEKIVNIILAVLSGLAIILLVPYDDAIMNAIITIEDCDKSIISIFIISIGVAGALTSIISCFFTDEDEGVILRKGSAISFLMALTLTCFSYFGQHLRDIGVNDFSSYSLFITSLLAALGRIALETYWTIKWLAEKGEK
jgi:predicted MFS family arabinose efflux permease